MKGIISSIRGQKVSGGLNVNVKEAQFYSMLVDARLMKEFPEWDLRAFRGIKQRIHQSVWEPREVFVEAVRIALLGVARLIYPDREYKDDTNLTLLYKTMLDFGANRDTLVKAYETNKA